MLRSCPNLWSLHFMHQLHLQGPTSTQYPLFLSACLAKMWADAPKTPTYFAHLEENLMQRHFLPRKGQVHYASFTPASRWLLVLTWFFQGPRQRLIYICCLSCEPPAQQSFHLGTHWVPQVPVCLLSRPAVSERGHWVIVVFQTAHRSS